jgi:hypothetical protein
LYRVPEPSTAFFRRGRLLRWGAAVAVLIALAGYLTVQYLTGGTGTGPSRCRVVSGHSGGKSYEFTPEQAVNAATISAVGSTKGLPERAVAIALATALQESGLRNLKHGDRDSLGLFQQRPSQGWGTRKQIMDPTYAADVFYAHLVKVPGYTKLPLTVAAQRVQRSGYPEAYAKHEPDAVLLAAALTGRSVATLTCRGRTAPTPGGGPDAVRAALVRDFGREVLQTAGAEVRADGGASSAAPSASSSASAASTAAPSPASSSSASGTVTVPVPRGTSAGSTTRQRGWELAHWAVANSSALHIERVSYAGREWSRGWYADEWRSTGSSGDGDSTAEVRIVTGG